MIALSLVVALPFSFHTLIVSSMLNFMFVVCFADGVPSLKLPYVLSLSTSPLWLHFLYLDSWDS